MDQNFKNHGRLVPLYHFVAGLLIIAGFVGSIVNLLDAEDEHYYSASLLVVVFFVLIIIFWYARAFALRAQDRAIRAEENFRHFLLSGKPLPNELKMRQIIGLRFASDNEFLDLVKRAIAENLSEKAIKQSIKNWKGDFNRA